jgi:fumarylacetoacetase
MTLDFTHAAEATSWVASANLPDADFPLQNLPYGVFVTADDPSPRIGVAIGDQVLDLRRARAAGLALPQSLEAGSLAGFMALPRSEQTAARHALFRALAGNPGASEPLRACLVPQVDVQMRLPCEIRNFTDFLTGIYHAEECGRLVGRPLGENFKWMPIAYHGRASSVVVTGTPIRRPLGQRRDAEGRVVYGPVSQLDYELELGVLIGQGNDFGEPIPVSRAEDHWFGLVLLNDWSARDVQRWEGQPLGPFLAKNFATTISPWVVTQDALAPFRVPLSTHKAGDPEPLPYLSAPGDQGIGIDLEVWVQGRSVSRPHCLVKSRFDRAAYWTIAQMIAHHTMGGCNLLTGDLLGTGTQSGPERAQAGCLLEMSQAGTAEVTLAPDERRTYLQDGDIVTLRAACERQGFRRIGFGSCSGEILPAMTPSH